VLLVYIDVVGRVLLVYIDVIGACEGISQALLASLLVLTCAFAGGPLPAGV